MIEDFADPTTGNDFDADICVIGAGAAGITIAHELANSPLKICLIESGALGHDTDTQELYAGENSGLPYFPLQACRLRYFGGTTNHWSGQCAPLSDLDFETRRWVPYSGWPIDRSELEPYYERAYPVCTIGENHDDETLFALLGLEKPELDPDVLQPFFFRFSPPTQFGIKYRKALNDASNIRVLLNANVLELVTDSTGKRVAHVDIKSLSGKSGRVRATKFVLACGGIENARILLLSTDANSTGLGNEYDLVGRFFMEHPEGRSATLVSQNPTKLLEIYLRHWLQETQYRPSLRTGDALQRQEEILGCCAVLDYTSPPDTGTKASIEIGRSLSKGEFPDELGRSILQIIKDLDEVIPNAYRYIVEGKEPLAEIESLYFKTISEQSPNPASRVTLSEETDALGQPRARLNWQLADIDRRSIEVMIENLGVEFGRIGAGRLKINEQLTDRTQPWQPRGGFHHMGTTKMSNHPKDGVVDSHCRVHSTENLYVAGSSVFPTSGHVNPTLTLVALAVRLADHLRDVS